MVEEVDSLQAGIIKGLLTSQESVQDSKANNLGWFQAKSNFVLTAWWSRTTSLLIQVNQDTELLRCFSGGPCNLVCFRVNTASKKLGFKSRTSIPKNQTLEFSGQSVLNSFTLPDSFHQASLLVAIADYNLKQRSISTQRW